MKRTFKMIYVLVISILMTITGCESNNLKDHPIVGTANTITSSAQGNNNTNKEEADAINNILYFNFSPEETAKKLAENYKFEEFSSDSYVTVLRPSLSGVNITITHKANYIASIIIEFDSAILEEDKYNDLENYISNVYSTLEFTYSKDIWQTFANIYIDQMSLTENSGFAEPIIGMENEDEGWSIIYYFYPEFCDIELKPYKFY